LSPDVSQLLDKKFEQIASKKGQIASQRNQGERYYLKAMNCTARITHKLYDAIPRSYRDLPLRLAEYGTCHRYEQSGELFGLMRVRSLPMNDAHIYCTEEQFESEFLAVNELYLNYFKLFGIEKYVMRFSTHDPAMAGNTFINIKDVVGESVDARHAGEIDVLASNWGMGQPASIQPRTGGGGGGGTGKISIHDLSFSKYTDKATPIMMKYCASGRHLASAVLTVRKPGSQAA